MSERLKLIGQALGVGVYPRMGFGGVLIPSSASISTAKESQDGKRRAQATETTPGAPGAPGASGASGASDQAAPFIGSDFDRWLAAEENSLKAKFPTARVITEPQGAVITLQSRLCNESPEWAMFVTMLSRNNSQPRSWGFSVGTLFETRWIGPRHTNYFDGSICAYEPTDHTWHVGMPLVELFGYYTLWAARHFHLRQVGFWPGPQRVHHASERLAEVKPNELCGCSEGIRAYQDCCRQRDLSEQSLSEALTRDRMVRRPPEQVVNFARGTGPPPSIELIFLGSQ
jgi:hypothetical protein